MFCTVPMTDSHVKKLEVTGMKVCSRHILWETEHHREVQQSDTVQSDVDVYVKRTIKNILQKSNTGDGTTWEKKRRKQ